MTNDKQQVRLLLRQGEHKGRRYPLKKDSVTLGSDTACNIVVKGSFVSPKHATINRRDDGLWMISNLSVNRTLVNQQEVETQQLVSGDMIQIGAEALFEFEVIDKNAKKTKKVTKDQKHPTGKEAKPFTRRPLIQIAIMVYLLLIVIAGFVVKELNRNNNDISLSVEEVELVLQNSRAYFTSDVFVETTIATPVSATSIETEQAAGYFQLISSLKASDSSEQTEANPLLDELLVQSRDHLYRAWKYEHQLRWNDAIDEYQAILATIPDIRIPLVSFVMKRIKLIKEKTE